MTNNSKTRVISFAPQIAVGIFILTVLVIPITGSESPQCLPFSG